MCLCVVVCVGGWVWFVCLMWVVFGVVGVVRCGLDCVVRVG